MLAYRARIPRPASRWPLPFRPGGAELSLPLIVRPLLLLKSDTVTRRPCIAGANQTSDNPLFGQLLVVVQGSSDAGDELDASSFGITEKAVLAGIALKSAAGKHRAAFRAAEGEVVNLRHNSVTARPARYRSSRKGGVTRERWSSSQASARYVAMLAIPHRGKADVATSNWRGAGRRRRDL